jgi:hypothetical protein
LFAGTGRHVRFHAGFPSWWSGAAYHVHDSHGRTPSLRERYRALKRRVGSFGPRRNHQNVLEAMHQGVSSTSNLRNYAKDSESSKAFAAGNTAELRAKHETAQGCGC